MPEIFAADTTVLHDRLHDLRNLLAVISSSVHLLRDGALSDQQAMLLYAADRSAMRGGDVVDRLLGRSGVRSPARIDLNSAIIDLQPVFAGLLGSQGRFTLDLCSDPLPLCVDRDDLENMLIELVVNARRAIVSGARCQVTIRSRRAGNRAWLSVADNGVGIARTTLQASRSANDHLHGLPRIGRWLTDVHGRLRWRSASGRGTVVSVILPLRVSLRTAEAVEINQMEVGNDSTHRVAA